MIEIPDGFTGGEVLEDGPFFQVRVAHRAGGRFVLKRLATRVRDVPEARSLLVREAQVLEALAGRATPGLAAWGEDHSGPWLVMDHIEGASLAERMQTEGISSDSLRRLARAALRALATIHSASDEQGFPLGIVHGDLSPNNLLLTGAGGVIIIDFGLARLRGDGPARGPMRGTLTYMSPEVARGEPATTASDVFALGASLLHAATGHVPRQARTEAAMLLLAADVPLDGGPLDALVPGLSAALEISPLARPSAEELA